MGNNYGKIEMRVETSASKREKVFEKMSGNTKRALDVLNRSDYANEEAYIDACVAYDMQRNSPEYRAIRREVESENRKRKEAAQAEAQAAAYKEIRASVALSGLDQREIDTKATEMARRDLAAGRIGTGDLGKTIERYAQKLGEERKDTLASNALFNKMLRGQL